MADEFDFLDEPDAEIPAKPNVWKRRYETQLGQTPKGALPPPSLWDALRRAAVSGVTLGAGNEIAAYAGAKGGDTSLNPYRIAKGMPTVEDGGFAEDKAARKAALDTKDEAAEAAYPVAYGVTDFVSSLPTAALMGGPVRNWKQALGAGAKVGGILGLTGSKGETGLEVAPDVAKGAAIGAPLGLLGYGLMGGAEKLGQKASDVLFNLRSLFGGEPPVNPGRALDALGVKPGSAPNEGMQRLLDQKVVPAEDFPPAAFTKASPGAPDALARVGKHPRVQVAQNEGVMASKRGLGSVEEQPWNDTPDAVSALVDLRRGIIPKSSSSMGLVGDAIAQGLKGARRMAGLDENLARSLADPAIKAELAQIIAAGREGLAPDAVAALASRGLSLLGAAD